MFRIIDFYETNVLYLKETTYRSGILPHKFKKKRAT